MRLARINDRAKRISRNPASKPTYKRRMLEALALGMSPTHAANAAGIGRSTAYLWRQEDPEFAAKWDEAVADGIDCLEDEAYRRAMAYSDKLLMFFSRGVGRRCMRERCMRDHMTRAGKLTPKCCRWRKRGRRLRNSACWSLRSRETTRNSMLLANQVDHP
jgi:hypothetical protein